MTTWKAGRRILREHLEDRGMPLDELPETIEEMEPRRVPGTAVYMSSNPDGTPHALLHNLEHNKIIHERVVTLTVETLEVPHATAPASTPTTSPTSSAGSG